LSSLNFHFGASKMYEKIKSWERRTEDFSKAINIKCLESIYHTKINIPIYKELLQINTTTQLKMNKEYTQKNSNSTKKHKK
jgi:hypothetical protein